MYQRPTRLALVLFALVMPVSAAEKTDGDFPEIHNSQDETIPLKAAQKTLASFDVPEGFDVELFASEPDIQQPIAMTFDHKGRLWVAENYTYAERGVKFDTNLRDRILIFEDKNGDGKFDSRKVFWDEGTRLTSIEIGFGGVWACCAPNLLFISDIDADDVPDGEPTVVLDGWAGNDSGHNIFNGLRWGPDGWLYGRHGITSTSFVGKPGTAADDRTTVSCGIWRYNLKTKAFEVVCEGTTNPWGMDWDQNNELFFINTVIGHLWHSIPGAIYKRMHGQPQAKFAYDLIDQTADHYHWDTAEKWHDLKKNGMSNTTDGAGGGHAHCGMMIYYGSNWPKQYRGNVFTLNLHGRRLNRDAIARRGATYTASHQPDFARVGDQWFRGIELTYGPNGAVYILDWSDIGECHENDGVHRTSGRIYRISHGHLGFRASLDLSSRTSLQLAKLQAIAPEWHARQARRLLQERRFQHADLTDAAIELQSQLRNSSDTTKRIRALSCLHVIEELDDSWLLALLEDPNEHIRTNAIRLIVDDGQISEDAIKQFEDLAADDKSGLVLTFLASSLQRIPHDRRWQLATNLSSHEEFATDDVLPKMIWYGLMDTVPKSPTNALKLIRTTKMPLIRTNVTKLLATSR